MASLPLAGRIGRAKAMRSIAEVEAGVGVPRAPVLVATPTLPAQVRGREKTSFAARTWPLVHCEGACAAQAGEGETAGHAGSPHPTALPKQGMFAYYLWKTAVVT
jgi:hypothetical protein